MPFRRAFRDAFTAVSAFLLLLGASEARAQQTSDAEAERRLAEQLLEMQDAIDRMLEGLDDETRARVEGLARRLRDERRAAPDPEPPFAPTTAAASPPPPPAAEPIAAPAEPAEADVAPTVSEAARTNEAPEPDPDPEPARAPSCTPLAGFDTNEDGALSGGDRLWRHFYLVTDSPKDDGRLSLFELDIRSVALDVSSYGTKGDAEGYVVRGDRYRFELIGRVSRKVPDGLLAVDAGGLARNGSARLLGADGVELGGLQILERGQRFVFEDGSEAPTHCP